jgi:DNA-binding IclR family transcriptional regulator
MPDERTQTVTERVVTLIGLLGRHEGSIGSRDAERVTGIDRSGVSRIFRQLESLGWAEQVDDRGNYTVGPELFAVAAAVRQRDSVHRAAMPFLSALADRFNENTYLARRRAHRVVFQEQVDCSQPIRYVIPLNEPFPLTTGAAGRAILSALPDDDVDAVIAEGLTAYTPKSIVDPAEYRAQVTRDRRLGYAYSTSGWVHGGAGVASSFYDAAGNCVGALTVSAPLDRLTSTAAKAIGPAVHDAAQRLSQRLGYGG